MSTQFPLYNILSSNLSSKTITNQEKEDIINVIEEDPKCHEIIFSLIRSFQINEKDSHYLPYECKKQKAGYKFNINKLPFKLQLILHEFILMHKKEMNHENTIKRYDTKS